MNPFPTERVEVSLDLFGKSGYFAIARTYNGFTPKGPKLPVSRFLRINSQL